jgi:ComF family protein
MPPICPKCGKPQPSGILCPGCVSRTANIDGIRSPLKFNGLAREAIHQFKYKNLRSLSRPLAALLNHYWQQEPVSAQVLVPVPLHPLRLRERGYNQSLLLAAELGKLLHLPVNSGSLVRTRYVLPQARTSSAEERRRNVKQAFACRNASLSGSRVLLIDDVATSGATLEACAVALKSAGAESVWGLVLAREI